MRAKTASPIPSFVVALFVLALLPRTAFGQEAPEGPEVVVPEAGDHPHCGITGEELPALVRLADVEQGSLLLATDHAGVYLPAPLLDTEVAIRVTGLVARTSVTQSFQNPTDLWVEGVYAFPLPENAAVDTLTMIVGDRVIEGVIQEREEARRTYEEAKAEGRKTTLLEQQWPNLFTTALANLGPGETARVLIEYQQELRYDAGRFELRFPMVARERYTPAFRTGSRAEASSATILNGAEASSATILNRAEASSAPSLAVLETTLGVEGGAAAGVRGVGAELASARSQPAPAVLEPPRSAGPINPVRLAVELEPGFPLARLESPSHEIRSRKAGRQRHEVELAGVVPADRDFVLEWAPAAGGAPAATLLTEEIGGETYALLMLMPPAEAAGGSFDLPREIVYVIDTSGSMAGSSIVEAKAALDLALSRLEPPDAFNIIEFDSATRRLHRASVPATPERVEEAREWVAGLEADGGTEMLGALKAALGEQEAATVPGVGVLRQVVFITDGAVSNEAELFAYIQAHLGESRLFTVGIGSAPNSYFMTEAAELGRGTFTSIGSPEEVAPKMGALFAKLDRPALAGVEVAWSDPGAETFPGLVPDLYHGEPVVVAAKLLTALGGEVVVRGGAAGTPWEVRLEALPAKSRSGLDKLWARRKIGELSRRLATGGDAATIRPAIVELGLTHHLVTAFTSLVAVDTTPTAPAGERPVTTLIPVNLPAEWGDGFAEGVLPQGGTSAHLDLAIGLLLFAAAVLCALKMLGRRLEVKP